MARIFPTRIVSRDRLSSGRTGPSVLLNDYDLFATSNYVPRLWVYREDLDLEALRSSLARTLERMPVFAGTLTEADGELAIQCDDRGAEIVVQDCSVPLPDDLAGLGRRMGRELITLGNPLGIARRRAPLLIVTLTRFQGGGTAVGWAATHLLCDGGSTAVFLRAWSQIAVTGEAPSEPTMQRDAIERLAQSYDGKERGGSAQMTEHNAPGYFLNGGRVIFHGKRSHRKVLRYSADEIARFKRLATDASTEDFHLSRYDFLIAHLWRELAAARKRPERPCELTSLLDLRSRRELDLPKDLIGNAFLSRELDGDPAWLRESSLTEIATAYRKRMREGFDREAVGKDLAWLREARKRGSRVMSRFPFVPLDGGVMINQRTRMGEIDFDLGAGRPIWFEFLGMFARQVLIQPTPEGEGVLAVLQTPPGEAERVERLPQP